MNQYYVAVIVYNAVSGFNNHRISGNCRVHVFRKFGKNYVVYYRRKNSTTSTVSIYCGNSIAPSDLHCKCLQANNR